RKDETDLDDKISHYIPFLKYHSRWEELSETDFVKPVTKMKGVYEQTAFKIRDKEGPTITNSIGELSETQLKILTDIMNYAKENDIQLLFTAVPTRIGSDKLSCTIPKSVVYYLLHFLIKRLQK
ncbi:hypothetical protein, partial [Clostridioides difficile]|uniref:hypothetical protein n=1 Tax=Clostridioides difficile TaxID=1496 RepID=UPI002358E01F